MSTQLLIYESAVPVSHSRHGGASVEMGGDYNFTRSVNAVPILAVEFPHAAAEYSIVFAGGETLTPTVILGMRSQENLYLAGDGAWQARYIPAFVRRYPFVFSSRDNGATFTLCVDEAYKGYNQDGRGQRLFNDDKKPTPFVENVLKFLEQYQIEFQRTQIFCKKLQELNLLEPMRAQVNLEGGERMSLTGFMAVNRDRLKALAPEKLAELAKTDELELLYLHLHSMRNFAGMRERLAATRAPQPVTGDAVVAEEPPKAAPKSRPATKESTGSGKKR